MEERESWSKTKRRPRRTRCSTYSRGEAEETDAGTTTFHALPFLVAIKPEPKPSPPSMLSFQRLLQPFPLLSSPLRTPMHQPQRMHHDAGGEPATGADTNPLLAHSPPEPSPEITDEEIEAASAACCRICLESECEPGDELISPCMCKGTQQFVHRSCLDHWRSVKEGTAFSHCTTCKAQFHLRVDFLADYMCRKIKFRLFVARDVILVFLAVQTVIAAIGGMAYLLDKNGNFRNRFTNGWDRILSKHPVPFYYCVGVVVFFVLVGFFGLIVQCSSFNNNDPYLAGSSNCCYGWGAMDGFPASVEACLALAVIFVIVFAILGIAYGFLAATMAIQRIWQGHYHILTKRELTKEYVVEDLRGCYTPPKMDPEHEQRLKMLQLL